MLIIPIPSGKTTVLVNDCFSVTSKGAHHAVTVLFEPNEPISTPFTETKLNEDFAFLQIADDYKSEHYLLPSNTPFDVENSVLCFILSIFSIIVDFSSDFYYTIQWRRD